mgnify:CR=1 FL=1|jgi:hypothetical protein
MNGNVTLSGLNLRQVNSGVDTHILANGERVDCRFFLNAESKNLIVFLPSAQSPNNIHNPVFHRSSWHGDYSDQNVLFFSDPSLHHAKIPGCWFISKNHDYPHYLSEIIRTFSSLRGIEKIVIYGSSMGGFGALMIASELENSVAIAEIPQIDLRHYHIASAISEIESNILAGQTIGEFSKNYPERISIIERFKYTGSIPNFKIITNKSDPEYRAHCNLLTSDELPLPPNKVGELVVIPGDLGHKPVDRNIIFSEISKSVNFPPFNFTARGQEIAQTDFSVNQKTNPLSTTISVSSLKIDANEFSFAAYLHTPDGVIKFPYSRKSIELQHNDLPEGVTLSVFVKCNSNIFVFSGIKLKKRPPANF